MGWYVISVTPGFEQRFKNSIESSRNLKEINKRVFVPVMIQKTIINGKVYFHNEKLFPGYLFIECEEKDSELIFSYISLFTGIMNMSSIKNSYRVCYPIEEYEMMRVVQLMYNFEQSFHKPVSDKKFEINERIRITSGPFSNFEGIIVEVNYPQNSEAKIKVCTRLFNNDLAFVVLNEFQVEPIIS